MSIRILLVDDHAVVREGLRALLKSQPDIELVGEAADGSQAEALTRRLRADVVVLDLAMEEEGGLQAIPRIRHTCPHTSIVVLTMHREAAYVEAALAAGAVGYVVKTASGAEVLSAIRAAAGGRTFVDRSAEVHRLRSGKRTKPKERTPLATLSTRERQVFVFVASGFTNREVAERIGISVKSVESFRSRVMEKLGLQSRAQLVRFALEAGVLRPGEPLPPN